MRVQYAVRALRILRRPGWVSSEASSRTRGLRPYATPARGHPVDRIVDRQLDEKTDAVQPTTSEGPVAAATPPPMTQREEIIAKAQIVFGSKLQGPQRRAQLDAKSTLVAGVLVPPKPEEPDNCCMSGCVNCVWDMYRDEMEEWAEKSTEARARLAKQKVAAAVSSLPDSANSSSHAVVSMDDDGGGSETNWNDEGPMSGDMFEGVPIGIRAFMETEKRLKTKHQQEKATSA